MLEAIEKIEALTGQRVRYSYSNQVRKGDHICYISDLRKLKAHYSAWEITRSLDDMLEEMVRFEQEAV